MLGWCMCLRMSSQDIVERSLILERSFFKTGTVAGGDVATGGAALTGGTSFWVTGSCDGQDRGWTLLGDVTGISDSLPIFRWDF